MNARLRLQGVALACLVATALSAIATADAGPFDKLKKKVADKVSKKADQETDEAIDKNVNKASDEVTGKKEGGEAAAPASEGAGDAAEPKGSGGKVSSVSTKFDYVPGDSVILIDDFTLDDLGEFPARWRLNSGTFETAEQNGERWLRCVSDDGHVRMKLPGLASLPEFWTLEFDADGFDNGSYLIVSALAAGETTVWETMYPYSSSNFSFRCGDIFSSTPIEVPPVTGRHHIMFMKRGTGLKIYFDHQRIASAPDVTGPGVSKELDFRLWAPGLKVRPMITNVRFAEGCRPAKDMLAEGKLVTYGIHFETGSDVVLPDSAPILRQIAAYLTSKPDVKLRVTGHTDNVGKAPTNLDLSKRRAAAVANVLATQFGVGADRFQTDGKGDTQPLANNAKPEGRAMNRRVEFAKIEG
jgi:OmpA-OmpF porin, OOP family